MIGRAGRQSRARLGRQRDWPLSTRHNVPVAERSKAVDLKSGTCRLERCSGPESLATIELMRNQQLSAAHASWKREVVARSRPAAGRSRYLPPCPTTKGSGTGRKGPRSGERNGLCRTHAAHKGRLLPEGMASRPPPSSSSLPPAQLDETPFYSLPLLAPRRLSARSGGLEPALLARSARQSNNGL